MPHKNYPYYFTKRLINTISSRQGSAILSEFLFEATLMKAKHGHLTLEMFIDVTSLQGLMVRGEFLLLR
jgi:hypothetical protein